MKYKAYLWSEVPAIQIIFARDSIKAAIRKESVDDTAFVQNAAIHIRRELFAGYPYTTRFDGRNALLKRLLEQEGYTTQQIGEALAEAWLRSDDSFYLPVRSIFDHPLLSANGLSFVLSFVLSLLSVFLLFLYGRRHFSDVTAIMLWLAPITFLMASVLAVIYFRLIQLVMRLFRKPDSEQ